MKVQVKTKEAIRPKAPSLTVEIDPDLLREVKMECVRQGITLKNVVDTYLRTFLDDHSEEK